MKYLQELNNKKAVEQPVITENLNALEIAYIKLDPMKYGINKAYLAGDNIVSNRGNKI